VRQLNSMDATGFQEFKLHKNPIPTTPPIHQRIKPSESYRKLYNRYNRYNRIQPHQSTSTISSLKPKNLSPTQPWQILAMAPSKNDSHTSSNRYGEAVSNILASAYCVDSSASLQGFHYSTTGAGGMFQCPSFHSRFTDIQSHLQSHTNNTTQTYCIIGAQWYP